MRLMEFNSPLWYSARKLCLKYHGKNMPCEECKKAIQKEHEETLDEIAGNPNQ